MQTHNDYNHRPSQLLEALREKADRMVANKQSEITAGKEGEKDLASWKHGDIQVRHMPDDEHGVLRISAGGSTEPGLPFNYLVFRGDVGKCEALLRKALVAITKYK